MRQLTDSERKAMDQGRNEHLLDVDTVNIKPIIAISTAYRGGFISGLDTAAEYILSLEGQIAALEAERDGLRAALDTNVKDLSRLVEHWRDEASGHYCQTYNTGQAKGLNVAANMLNEYVKELERRTERQDKPPAT